MSDIFISYANENRDVARQMAAALKSRGWSVWWDREIAVGKPFDHVIEEELNAARCVVVLWTSHSVRSRWVKAEASVAADKERLVPVLLEDVAIPLEFRRLQTAMLTDWNGDGDHPEFVKLLDDVTTLLGQSTVSAVKPPAAPRIRRERPAINPTMLVAAAVVLIAVALVATVFRSGGSDGASSTPTTSSGLDPSGVAGASVASGTGRPRGDAIAIKIGDTIGEDMPVSGAGIIDRSGAQDVYAFAASAGQRAYFRMIEHTPAAMSQIRWTLSDPDGMDVFSTCLGCGDPGVQSLRKAGTYTLTVGNDRDPVTGVYRLRLYDVPPPNQFSIKVGDTIQENVPGLGAGEIESPGAQDIYRFTISSGQRVFFRMLQHAESMSQIRWTLTDPDGMDVFSTCLGCGDPGVQTLRRPGSYTLTVGAGNNPATGTYQLQLTPSGS